MNILENFGTCAFLGYLIVSKAAHARGVRVYPKEDFEI